MSGITAVFIRVKRFNNDFSWNSLANHLFIQAQTAIGHKNIQNTRIYAQITASLRQEVFAKLERHPKIVRVA